MIDNSKYVTSGGIWPAAYRASVEFLNSLKARAPHGIWGVLGALASVALFGLALYSIAHTLSEISYADLGRAIRETYAQQIFGSLALTAVSYLFLTGYDAVALRLIGAYAPYRVAAFASFTSCAISFNLGFAIITSSAVRYWIYSRVGLTAVQVATVTLLAGVNLWLGMVLTMGVGLVRGNDSLAELDGLPPFLHSALGILILAVTAAYCVWTALGRRQIRMRGLSLQLPSLLPTLAQLVFGLGDLCFAAAALYVLLPSEARIEFISFLTVYVFACTIGVISHAPGGIGVFEAVMLHAIPGQSRESVLASLLLFRVIYYFVPFFVAFALLGADEGSRRWASLRETITRIVEQRGE